jgi:hypothetical protein
VSFDAITFRVACQQVFIVFISLSIQSENFMIHSRMSDSISTVHGPKSNFSGSYLLLTLK